MKFSSNNAKNDGGAIVFSCPSFQCSTNILNSTFMENTAGLKGGALQYNNLNFTSVNQTTFRDNFAPSGKNFGSYPGKIIVSSHGHKG